jgi:hypothetical protein
MKSTTKRIAVAMVALAAVGAGGSVALLAQEKPKPDAPKQEKHAPTKGEKEEAKQKKAEQIAALKKSFPNARTSLAAALATGEAETRGRAHSVAYTMTKEGKLTIEVGLLVNDKLVALHVDPDTGKPGPEKALEGEGAKGEKHGKGEGGKEHEEDEDDDDDE